MGNLVGESAIKDYVALALGIISVISWSIAEIPQIYSNYLEKSTEGLSIIFLITWTIGDIFNLVGCLLEPATLPTQFYTALLYTITTLILTGQTIYYNRLNAKRSALDKTHKLIEDEKNQEHKTGSYEANGSSSAEGGQNITSIPIPVSEPVISRYGSAGRDLYYMSARSLTKSPAPTWLGHSRDSSRTPVFAKEPLLGSFVSEQSTPPSTKSILCVVSSATFLVCIYGYNLSSKHIFSSSDERIIFVGRKLLQSTMAMSSVKHGGGSSEIGSILGWAMTAIYLGGRLPQIFLNMKRGNAEGLSPLMFMFALIGNLTYVGSILVKSMEWSKIRPNLPWLVDAGGCVLLDSFILIQFIYFRYWKTKGRKADL